VKNRRVVRGGSWNNNQQNARAAYRNNNAPDNRNNNLGVRLACSSHIFRPPATAQAWLTGLLPACCERSHPSGTGSASGIGCRPRFAARGAGS
jgi:hypothetical protein